ncbi:MAG: AAA family ATPase [Clostridia bacterium]|nr:AAA family ATPase [Clostridia bacterium]
MELRNVDIKNFKSIEKIELDLEKDCKILVGLSESGKTNFLTALRTLDSSIVVDQTYVKEGTRKEKESSIDFELCFTEDEKKIILEELLKTSKKLDELILKNGKKIDLMEFIDNRLVYRVDVRNNTRKYLHYTYDKSDQYVLNTDYTYINAKASNKVKIKKVSDASEIELETFTVISNKEFTCEIQNEIKELYNLLEQKVIEIVENKNFEIPKVLYWEYDDKYLLPASVNIQEFINDSNICVPLKNMFELCNITNIKEEYDDKKAMGESSFQNLLDDISDNVDNYLKKIWKSMPKNTKIVLQEVGDLIKIRIKDSKNTYSASKRSDGFKRIVTFLLMLSIDNKNNTLNNTLLLIDEPDSKIDIPGQEYLRDELINIGKNNYVIYSTHSTDMIDNKNIDRHIIMKKEEESSTIELANDDNYMDVATLYRALGMNVYSVINEHNLVFEGWSDQLVFELYNGKRNTNFKNVGITHLSGITKSNQYAEFWGLLSKKYYIISDSDATALQMKDSFTENRYSGIWLTYGDLSNNKVITLEDFITNDKILKTAKDFKESNNFSTDLVEENLKVSDNKANSIEKWIILNNGNKNVKNMMKKFKSLLYSNLKKSDITSEYDGFIKKLIETIKTNSK